MLESLERKTHHSGGIIESYLAQHDSVRNEAINLIVSENRMSKRAMAPLSSVVFIILCHFFKLWQKEMTYDKQNQFRYGCSPQGAA